MKKVQREFIANNETSGMQTFACKNDTVYEVHLYNTNDSQQISEGSHTDYLGVEFLKLSLNSVS